MNNHLKSIPHPITLAAILAWEFCGNAWSDGPAFKSIDDFVRDTTKSVNDRAEAITHMGLVGMGIARSEEEVQIGDEAYVYAYLNC